MSSLIQEINHYPKESVYSQLFRICFLDDVFYEKITRKQMAELIIQQYTPENIVDVCTVKELKFLKRIVENNYKEVDGHKLNPFVCHRRKPTTFRWWEEPCEPLAINPDSKYTFV